MLKSEICLGWQNNQINGTIVGMQLVKTLIIAFDSASAKEEAEARILTVKIYCP